MTRLTWFGWCVAALLAGRVAAQPAPPQPVSIPGTSVTIAAPAGFTLATSFAGLENRDTGSSITVNEFPADAYRDLSAVFTSQETAAAQFARQGIEITSLRTLSSAMGEFPFAVGRQTANGVEVLKYISLIGGDRTAIVTFNLVGTPTLAETDAHTTMQSVVLGRALTLEEKVASLGYTVEAAAPFHIADVLAGTNVVLTTFDGTDPSGLKPVIVIVRTLNSVNATDAAQIGEPLLRSMDGFASAEITSRESRPFAGGDAELLSAVAGGRTIVQLTRLFPDGRYIRFVAIGETAAIESARAAIMEVAGSIAISE